MSEKWKLIKLVLEQWCDSEDNYTLTDTERKWFAFKAIVCILFNLPECEGYDTITVAAFNSRWGHGLDCSSHLEWDEIVVAHDGWQWSYVNNSNC